MKDKADGKLITVDIKQISDVELERFHEHVCQDLMNRNLDNAALEKEIEQSDLLAKIEDEAMRRGLL